MSQFILGILASLAAGIILLLKVYKFKSGGEMSKNLQRLFEQLWNAGAAGGAGLQPSQPERGSSQTVT